MPWPPRFQEAAESTVIDKLLAVVHRDMKIFLDNLYGVGVLPDFAVMTLDDDTNLQCPLFVAGVARMTSLESNSGHYLDQELHVGCGIVVEDTTIGKAKRKAYKYVRAFKMLIRSATAADLLPPSAQMLDCVIDIDHQYLEWEKTEDGTGYTQPVRFVLKYKFGET